ncbi:uncharacterized protein LOC110852042 isoform X2 [Folsomia candida]|uniref:uncharacterized protein LOC110852042 isoform X2 n=1 Tax=Folsomia candida TaxID=158441 RepID=UPI0016055825|nr:uncharacterized protein LOC110852042 isoform X2 [Folsomia candida]XP_035702236.1 uncharacterized protein LOC110852042 isoform X2 [Folsomia candida]
MSSYRSNYVQWKASGLGNSSSYSPASSTSSLASSTSSSTNKYAAPSSSLTAPSFRSPVSSREPSFVGTGGSGSISVHGTSSSSSSGVGGRLGSRYSTTLSSKGDNLSSSIPGNASSSSNLSSGTKSNTSTLQSSSSPSSRDVKSTQPYSSLASVSALSSKFSSPKEPAVNSFRLPTSNSSYLRSPPPASTAAAVSGGSESSSNLKSKSALSDGPTTPSKQFSSGHGISTSAVASKLSEEKSTSEGSSAYRPYSSRTLTTSNVVELSPLGSSALRTTARFGLRSAHYNSAHPTASTLKAAAALAEESKKELHKNEKKIAPVEEQGPVSWMSRGSTTDDCCAASNDNKESLADVISAEEIPSFEPRVFSPRYEGVLKHKGIQTEEEPKPKVLPSSIPRPTLSLNYYSSAYGSSLAKFGAKNPAKQPNDDDDSNNNIKATTEAVKGSNLNLKVKTRVGSVKEKDANTTIKSSPNACTTNFNNNKDNHATPVTLTSGSDQSSRSSQRTINNKIVAESGSSCNNEPDFSPSIGAAISNKTTTNSTNEEYNGINKESAATAAGVVALANKEFGKSALKNVGDLSSKDASDEFAKKQGDPRLNKSVIKNVTPATTSTQNKTLNNESSACSTPVSAIEKESMNNNVTSTNSGPQKHDLLRRPPADPKKSSSAINSGSSSSFNQPNQVSQIMTTANSTERGDAPLLSLSSDLDKSERDKISSTSSPSSSTGERLMKTKSSKSINQLRKLSTASTASSESESCSSLTSSTSSSESKNSGNDSIKKPNKQTLLFSNNNHNLDNKGQGRRGSSSSAASSRSSSVERSVVLGATNVNKIGKNSNNNILPTKPPSGPLSTKINPPLNNPPPTNSLSKSKSKKLITSTNNNVIVDGCEMAKKEITAKPPPSSSSSSTAPSSSRDAPVVQTSFLERMMGNDKPWLRKCQSGELPWWLKSNQDVPGILGKTPSKTSMTTKDENVTEKSQKDDQDSSSSSDLSDDEDFEFDELSKKLDLNLGERTAPDGVEVPAMVVSPRSTLQSQKSENFPNSENLNSSNSENRRDSLFIGSIANIDDLLGTVSPSPISETPSLAPTPTPANLTSIIDDLCEAQKLNLNDDDESSSSSEDEVEDDLDKTDKLQATNAKEGSDVESSDDDDDDASTGTSSSFEVDPCSVKIGGAAQISVSQQERCTGNSEQMPQRRRSSGTEDQQTLLMTKDKKQQLDDTTLQLYKDGEFGQYLDLESTISEQQEDFEGFLDNRKNSIVLRACLPVRVHAIIEKLLTENGRELRRALFSLKQIFQEDKDLVHEFVENGGLNCLIKVGSDADQNYQNYILRAIGQVMLYVDGMYGVMRHNETIQWLYNLVASKFPLVQKTALKLLLVFVDYRVDLADYDKEATCLLLIQAVSTVDHSKGLEAWSNVMNLLREQDSNSGDSELGTYAMTLVNKVLNAIPDIDTYYDQVDALEEQGMATIIQSYMGKQCADLDLLKQFQIYELVLKHEDGEEDNIMMQLDESMRSKLLSRKGYSETETGGVTKDRRKSRRHSTSTPPTTPNGTSAVPAFPRRLSSADVSPYSSLSSSSSINGIPNGHMKEKSNMELTPGLRRRRERAEHQKNLILEQLVNGGGVNGGDFLDPSSDSPTTHSEESLDFISLRRSSGSRKDLNSLEFQNNLRNSGGGGGGNANGTSSAARPWMLPIYTKSNGMANSGASIVNAGSKEGENRDDLEVKRENTVKDLTQKLASQNLLASPEENKSFIINGELSGVISKAKEGLAKSKSRLDMKQQPNDSNSNKGVSLEVKKSDNELEAQRHWEFLINNLQRPLEICDLDFTDLQCSDDEDILAPDPSHNNMNGFGCPPPVPMMMMNGHGPPPPPPSSGSGRYGAAPPPPINGFGPPLFGVNLKNLGSNNTADSKTSTPKKTKKTVKLFWKEVRDDPITASKLEKVGCIWNEIEIPPIDTQKLENLFESRAKDIISKEKQSDVNKTKEIVVLDPKRSNAINIGMTKLPPPRTIKAAIMKMDSTIVNREGIEKLLTMLPTEEERAKITEAQFANPLGCLGSAEQFLLTLSQISELTARLKLWAFKLDYENLEREVCEPLMDLKTGIVDLEKNKTFRYILSTLLSIGNFLNGGDAKGFQIEYLSKVPEVKDTVQKHSLLHHLCQTVNENYPDSSDLYSEIGPVTRASRVDFDEICANLVKMENDCKTSWDHLRVIAKHDGPTNLKLKLSEFLADCAERIIVLGMIHRRVLNRFHKFLLWLGVAAHQVSTTKPHTLFKIISEFALEYRTTRERVIQQMQKKASHRERNKTRGKMITEQIMYKSKEDQEDEELRQVLNKTSNVGTEEVVNGSLTWSRRLKPPATPTTPTNTLYHNFNSGSRSSTLSSNGTLGDGDDEILESLVKTATRTADTRVATRERKRNNGLRNSAERKSLVKRSRTRENNVGTSLYDILN